MIRRHGLSSIAALGLALLPGSALAQQKSLNELLVGTWTAVSLEQTIAYFGTYSVDEPHKSIMLHRMTKGN